MMATPFVLCTMARKSASGHNDWPEAKQTFGTRAKQFLTRDLAFGQTVTVKVRDIDRHVLELSPKSPSCRIGGT